MIKYYRLFDLLNRKGKKKTDLLEIMSSRTLAKLSKGETVSSEVIDKICLFLDCQPNDIMEIFEVHEIPQENGTTKKVLMKTFDNEKEEFEHMLQNFLRTKEESYEKTKKEMQNNAE